jgi:hypothetical protein
MRRLVGNFNSPGQDELNSRSIGLEYTCARRGLDGDFAALQKCELVTALFTIIFILQGEKQGIERILLLLVPPTPALAIANGPPAKRHRPSVMSAAARYPCSS